MNFKKNLQTMKKIQYLSLAADVFLEIKKRWPKYRDLKLEVKHNVLIITE